MRVKFWYEFPSCFLQGKKCKGNQFLYLILFIIFKIFIKNLELASSSSDLRIIFILVVYSFLFFVWLMFSTFFQLSYLIIFKEFWMILFILSSHIYFPFSFFLMSFLVWFLNLSLSAPFLYSYYDFLLL